MERARILDRLKTKFAGQHRRAAVIGGAVLALFVLLIWSFRPQPVPADIVAAERGDLVVTIGDEGETRVRNVYVVSAPVAGRVARITLEVGDSVVAGETVLAVFQPQDPALLDVRSLSEAEAGVGLSEADQARARAELDFARQELSRAEQLAKEGTIPTAALDRARLLLRTAQASFNQASAAVAKRQADLQTARAAMETAGNAKQTATVRQVPVYAPVSGRILKRLQESAGLLPAGTPLLEIGDPAELEIVTDLLSTDAVKVREGHQVIIEDWGGPQALTGVVRRIEPFGFTKVSALGVEEQRVNVVIDITSPHDTWSVLGHGYRVMTRVVTNRAEGVVKVPVGALFRTGTDWTVYRVDGDAAGGTAELRAVRVGARNTLEAEIMDGLAADEYVIVYPNDQVSDGVRVVPRPSTAP